MNRFIQHCLASVLCLAAVFAALLPAAAAPAGSGGSDLPVWGDIIGKPAEERQQLYEQLTFAPASWEAGQVLSFEPLVVVTEKPGPTGETAAKIRVWTGWLGRAENDLVTVWDELWIGRDGKVILAVADMESAIPDYFLAPRQNVYQHLDWVGRYPWVSVPTDAEAEAAGLPRVPAAGVTNAYGLSPEGEADAADAPAVKPLPVIPDRVRPKRHFPEAEIPVVPPDIEGHWAREDILNLMGKGVVKGYEDGTIRPQRTLTRAEFITLLLRGLQLEPKSGGVSSYNDVAGHWARDMIAEAERLGILPKSGGQNGFGPNEAVSRLEMAVWAANALSLIGRTQEGPPAGFKDTGRLTDAQQTAIRKTVNNGVLRGYEDGTFRPERSLTRAEAFVVTLRLIEL
ncbi:MAG TPA: S-layer homology domain-containing protein [Paenibacillaceae bacterium]